MTSPRPSPASRMAARQRMIEQNFVERSADLRAVRLRAAGDPRGRAAGPVAAQGETSKEVYRPAPPAGGPRPTGGDDIPRLHFDLTVPFARFVLENSRQAAVPVPALPDPEGVARRAPAGGPLPRVPAGRHRRGRPRQPAVPLRHRDAAGDRATRFASLPIPQATIMVNNRKVCEGFYRGWAWRIPTRCCGRSTSSTRSARRRWRRCCSRPAGATDRRPPRASSWPAISAAGWSFVDAVGQLGRHRTPLLDEGLDELVRVSSRRPRARARPVGRPELKIAPWLDYYTALCYETRARGLHTVRLHLLRRSATTNPGVDRQPRVPGVGISIGCLRGCSGCCWLTR
jgi:histidyl-tRNA synthetase